MSEDWGNGFFASIMEDKKKVPDDADLRQVIKDKYNVVVIGGNYIELSLMQCVINTVRDWDRDNEV